MKILVYSNKESYKVFLTLMESIPLKYSLDYGKDFNSFKTNFKKEKYDIVFVDLDDSDGKKVVQYIKDKKPSQKTILISGNIHCSEESGCNFCLENYNQYRLIKPVEVTDLVYAFKKNIECELAMCDDKFISQLMLLIKPFKSFSLNKNSLKLNEIGDNSTVVVKDKIILSQVLTTNDIKFNVLEDHIQIFKS